MLQFKIPDKQYVLSLDSLDLNFLSQYVQKPSDEERILWSKSVEEDSALYQVEIVSDEEAEQDGDAFIEPYESYLCYICNLDVPKKYYKQHNKSAKHQNHKKLVEKVLENVGKQLNTDIDSVPNKQEYDMFYCETCCKVVTRNNIRNHTKSNYHKQAIENEKLNSKFIESYIYKNNNEGDILSEINYENDLDSEFSSPSDSDWCDDTNADSNSKNNINNDVPCEGNNCNGIEEVANFQNYLKDMVVKYNLAVKLPLVVGDSVVIITPKGHKEHITIDAFHSYKKMNGFAFCLLCAKWVQENIKQHSVSEEHVRNIFLPINDNFARQMVNDEKYSHCLICNERFLTTSNHVSVKPKHMKYLHPSALKSKECGTNPESFSVQSNSISHEEPSTSYLSKSAIDSTLPNSDLETVEDKLKEYRKQFTFVTAKTLQCLVCPDSNVFNIDDNVIVHVEGKLHSKACADLLLKNYLTQISSSVYYCNLCNIVTDDFVKHIKSHDKNKKISSASNKQTSANNLSTSAVDSSLPNTGLGTVEEKLNAYLKQFIVNKNVLKCLICSNCNVPYSNYNIITHVEGRPHSEACANFLRNNCLTMKSLSVYYCSLCKKSTDDFVDHVKLHVKRKPVPKRLDKKHKFIKYVHEDPLNASPEAIQCRKEYKVCLQKNQIVLRSNNRYHCNICSLTMSRISEIYHMFGERHRLVISSTSNAN